MESCRFVKSKKAKKSKARLERGFTLLKNLKSITWSGRLLLTLWGQGSVPSMLLAANLDSSEDGEVSEIAP